MCKKAGLKLIAALIGMAITSITMIVKYGEAIVQWWHSWPKA